MFFQLILLFSACTAALDNVALGKPAKQVSTYSSGTADKAVDGNTAGQYSKGFCTRTNTNGIWWKVDLMGFYKVISVDIFTRTDCCWDRLQQFEVRVSLSNPLTFPSTEGQQCLSHPAVANRPSENINCTQPIRGRYVSLFKPTSDVLTICELRVFADKEGMFAGYASTPTSGAAVFKFPLTSYVLLHQISRYYSVVLENCRLVEGVQRSLQAASVARCAEKCAQTVSCYAFNAMTSFSVSNNRVTCELLANVTFVAFQDWSPAVSQQNGWRVYAMRLQ